MARKEKMKETVKEYRKLVAAGKKEEAKVLLSKVYKVLDKTAKVNLVKKGHANRLKSRLAKKLA